MGLDQYHQNIVDGAFKEVKEASLQDVQALLTKGTYPSETIIHEIVQRHGKRVWAIVEAQLIMGINPYGGSHE